jgi:hypothetical protein
MSDWIICPTCDLKHVARPDAVCPRCKQTVVGALTAGLRSATLPGATIHADGLPTGAWLAAGVLFANAVAGVLVLVLTQTSPARPAGIGNTVAIVVDVFLATALLLGRHGAVAWALVRAVLGGLILTPILWSNAGAATGIAQALYSLGLVLLLAGDPGVGRILAGLVPTAGTLLLVVAMVGSPPVGRRVSGLVADLLDRHAHVEHVERVGGGWRLELPPGAWHEAKAPPGIERMVSWPEEDAHIMVSAHAGPPGTELDVFKVADGLLDAIRKTTPTLVEVERKLVPARTGSGLAVRATLSATGKEVEGWYVVIVSGIRYAVAVALAPRERFDEVGPTLLGIAQQLEL